MTVKELKHMLETVSYTHLDVYKRQGYALSEDGLWRCHSWVVQPMARTVRVWETTVKRVAYFGVVLTSEECEDFVENNT